MHLQVSYYQVLSHRPRHPGTQARSPHASSSGGRKRGHSQPGYHLFPHRGPSQWVVTDIDWSRHPKSITATSRDVSKKVYLKTAQRKVLGLLAFAEMRSRADIVEKAHEATFKWMFEGQSSAGQEQVIAEPTRAVDPKSRARVDSFVQWLSSDSGIYHIAGKLGCGKSTLLKYLAAHDRVLEELQRWAGIFFWRRGTPLQQFLSGLFRTLLHDILEQRSDLVPVVLPDLWNEVSLSPMWDAKVFALDTQTVQSAFS
ncbi:hypothetical protein C8A05DRAFT_16114 [Staphylotrichum tortipilum]|uniref:Nephrocystin 3-like N-terminal domain-containing protein n=1 Tax=Staphylotrichum tortipilum TaxID=2831512 RepID=A0AAN6MJK4_9PEZI|nr:hypothetical protein C8A05DRAFT_16114 [Staphylotrichum longicolle]